MLNEFIGMKFTNLSDESDTKIYIHLKDFWLNPYTEDSVAKQAFVSFAGGELNYSLIANVVIYVKITKNGKEVEKTFKATGEKGYVQGIGTGTQTGNLYRGKESSINTRAATINNANNKALMMLNKFMEANEL